jgi:hypothetical protein
MSEVLLTVIQAVIRDVNYVKNSPLMRRHFAKSFDDTEAEHMALLHYHKTCWLFHAKVFHRVFELKKETAIFLRDDNNNDDTNLCQNENYILKLAYLVDIFLKTK